MDNEATHRLNANNIWQLCNTFDDRSSSGSSTINSCDSSNNSNIGGDSQHSDDSSCCSSTDPDGFVYPPSNHSSPTVVGVAIKRSLKVTESDLEPAMPKMTMETITTAPATAAMPAMPALLNNNNNRAERMIMMQKEAAAAPPNVLVDCSAPIVDLDASEIDGDAENEGVDVFYECNNNYPLKTAALYDAKRTLCAAAVDLISNGNHVGGGGPKPQPNLIDSDALTDLFIKKYHAHNELIENNYYCINTKRIEETINLIDLHDDGDVDATTDAVLLQPVVIDTRPKAHGPNEADVIATGGSVESVNHNGPSRNGNNGDHNLHVQQAALEKDASLLDLCDESVGKVVDSLLGDTVCTNHLLADVREDFERLKVNVCALNGHFGSDAIDGHENTPRTTSDTSDHNNSFHQRNESDSNQLVNSIINQSDTANSRTPKRSHQPTTVHLNNIAGGEQRQQQQWQQQQPGRTPPKITGEEDIVNIIDIDVHGKMFYYSKLFACYFGLSFFLSRLFLLLSSVCPVCVCGVWLWRVQQTVSI